MKLSVSRALLPLAFLACAASCSGDDTAGYGIDRGPLGRPRPERGSVGTDPGPLTIAVEPGGAGSGRQLQDSEFAQLVPQDAVAFFGIESLEDVGAIMGVLAKATGQADAAMMMRPDMLVQMMMVRGGDAGLVRRDAPLGVAFTISSETGQPEPTFILPVHSARAFMRTVREDPNLAPPRQSGTWVGVPTGSTYTVGDEPSAMLRDLPARQVVLRFDVEKLVETYRPMIAMGLAGMERQIGSSDDPVEQHFGELTLDFVQDFVDSAQFIDLSLGMQGAAMDMAWSMSTLPGSPLASFASGSGNDLAELAPYVRATDTISVLAGWDQEFFQRHVEPLLGDLAMLVPESEVPGMADALDRFQALYPAFGSNYVASGDMNDGVRVVVYLKPKDPQKVIELFTQVASTVGEQDLVRLIGPTHSESEGTSVSSFVLELDEDPGSGSTETMRREMVAVLGDTRMHFRLVSKGGHMALIVGGDEEFFEDRVRELGNPPKRRMPSDLERAFQRIADSTTSFAYRIEMTSLARWMGRMAAAQIDIGDEFDIGTLSRLGSEPITLTVYGAIDGTLWHGGMLCDFDELARFVNATK